MDIVGVAFRFCRWQAYAVGGRPPYHIPLFFLDISVIWTKRWSLLDACAASAKVRNCSDAPAIIRNNAATGDVVAVRARGTDQ